LRSEHDYPEFSIRAGVEEVELAGGGTRSGAVPREFTRDLRIASRQGATLYEFPTNIGNRVPNLVTMPTMAHFGLDHLIGGNRFNQALENPLINIADFTPPPFTPGHAGRNIVTGPASYYSQVSAKKNFRIKERWNLQIRYDFQNPFQQTEQRPTVRQCRKEYNRLYYLI
jgi:hypothetical protein